MLFVPDIIILHSCCTCGINVYTLYSTQYASTNLLCENLLYYFFTQLPFSFIGNAFPFLFDIHFLFLFCMSRALESCYDIMICTNTFFYAKEFIIQSINFAALIKYACFTLHILFTLETLPKTDIYCLLKIISEKY